MLTDREAGRIVAKIPAPKIWSPSRRRIHRREAIERESQIYLRSSTHDCGSI
jgi:hypothetical protein